MSSPLYSTLLLPNEQHAPTSVVVVEDDVVEDDVVEFVVVLVVL